MSLYCGSVGDLLRALKRASACRTRLAVLCVRGGVLSVESAGRGDMACSTRLGASSHTAGAWPFSMGAVMGWLAKLAVDDAVSVRLDGDALRLGCGRARMSIPVLSADMITGLPDPDDSDAVTVPPGMARMIRRLAPWTSPDPTTPLYGVHIEGDALAVSERPDPTRCAIWRFPGVDLPPLTPASGDVMQIWRELVGVPRIAAGSGHQLVVFDDVGWFRIGCYVEFPFQWQRVEGLLTSDGEIRVDRAELLAVLGRMASVVGPDAFVLAENSTSVLTLSAIAESGSVVESIASNGPAGFCAEMVVDRLAALVELSEDDEDEVALRLTRSGAPLDEEGRFSAFLHIRSDGGLAMLAPRRPTALTLRSARDLEAAA